MVPVYSLRNIQVHRGKGFTLSIDKLDVEPGGIYALTGPNGAGKSTLLRTLALLTRPDGGELRVAGRPVGSCEENAAPWRRQITLVEQHPYLFEGSVSSNLAFGLQLRGIRGREQRRRIAATLQTVGLDGFGSRSTRALSGGEAQRVALARALVLRPAVLLLDEPTSNIDSKGQQDLDRLIAGLPEQGITVLLSTHDRNQPRRLGAELIRIRDGRLEESPPIGPCVEPFRTAEAAAWR